VKLDRPGLFQVEQDSESISWSAALHEVCQPAYEKKVVAWKDEVWIAVAVTHNSALPQMIRARRLILSSASSNPLQVSMRNEGRILLDLASDGGGAILLLASSQQGQPAVQLVERGERRATDFRNIAVAPRGSASVLMGAREPAAMVWAATPETGGLDVRLSPYYFARVELVPWPSNGDGKLEGLRASGFALAAGLKRLHLALGDATVAVLSKGNELESVLWQGGSAFNATVDSAADHLTLFHTHREEDRFAVEAIPLRSEDLLPPLAPGAPYEWKHLSSGIVRMAIPAFVDTQSAPVRLHVRGSAESVTFMGNGGQVLRGLDFELPAGGGNLEIKHQPGLLLCWLDLQGHEAQGLWPAAPDLSKAELISLPATRKLRGSTGAFQIKTGTPILLHVRMASPSVSLLKRAFGEKQVGVHQYAGEQQVGVHEYAGEQQVGVHEDGTVMDAYLPVGTSQLCLRAVGGAELSGFAEFTASQVTSIGEGLGPEVLLAPGDSRLFSFKVKQPGLVGIGVRASSDVVESELLSSSGKSLGKGTVQKANLQPGIYLLSLKAPAQGESIRARPAVVGIVPPGTDPPEEVIRKYFEPEEAPPQFTSSRRATPIESEEYTGESDGDGIEEAPDEEDRDE
jgi:hypothetical protein